MTSYFKGYGGYCTTAAQAANDIQDISSRRLTAYRYWFYHQWYATKKGYSQDKVFNPEVADTLVGEAEKLGVCVILDCHNYPPEAYIANTAELSSFYREWLAIAERYKFRTNVILELVNENGAPNLKAMLDPLVVQLREAGVKNHLIISLWWNHPNTRFADNLDDYSISRHFYPSTAISVANQRFTSTTSSESIPLPADLGSVLNMVYGYANGKPTTVQQKLDAYFTSATENIYVQNAMRQGLRFASTEVGPGFTDAQLNYPSIMGMAYYCGWMRLAQRNGVPFTAYRSGPGTESKIALYEQRAKEYFGISLWP